MEDVVYQVNEISKINDVIEVEKVTSLCDNVVMGQQVDAFILLSANNMDEDNEKFEFEENVESNENNEDYEDKQSEQITFFKYCESIMPLLCAN